MQRSPDDLPRAALLMTLSALLFAAMGVGVKVAAGAHLPNAMIVFFRSFFGLVALVPWLLPLGWRGLRTARPLDHLPRAVLGIAAMYLFFYAIGRLRLADAVLLNYSLPLFVPFIEAAWLREPIPRAVWPPVGVGLLGIALILKPGHDLFQPAALVALLSAVCAAGAQVGVRRLTSTEPVVRIVFYFAILATLVSATPLPWAWQTPEMLLWPALIATGVLATLAQLVMTQAYAHAPAARVGPFVYTSVVFAAGFEWLFWGVLPDRLSVVGAALVAAAGALALRAGRPWPKPPLTS